MRGGIRIRIGRFLLFLAAFGSILGIPITTIAAITGDSPATNVLWCMVWAAGYGLVGYLSYWSGRNARTRYLDAETVRRYAAQGYSSDA